MKINLLNLVGLGTISLSQFNANYNSDFKEFKDHNEALKSMNLHFATALKKLPLNEAFRYKTLMLDSAVINKINRFYQENTNSTSSEMDSKLKDDFEFLDKVAHTMKLSESIVAYINLPSEVFGIRKEDFWLDDQQHINPKAFKNIGSFVEFSPKIITNVFQTLSLVPNKILQPIILARFKLPKGTNVLESIYKNDRQDYTSIIIRPNHHYEVTSARITNAITHQFIEVEVQEAHKG